MNDVLVVGGGVAGLTTAHCLLAAGLRVTVAARSYIEGTTSAVAGAFWYPYRAFPEDKVAPWASAGYRRFAALAASTPEAGVLARECLELFPGATPAPAWAHDLPDFDVLPGPPGLSPPGPPDLSLPGPPGLSPPAAELPPGFLAGHRFTTYVVETAIYLPWLIDQVRSAGADLRVRSFATLDEALAECPRVINCAGLGARELAPDPSLVAVRGQVVRVTNPGISRVTVDEYSGHGITYVVPRSRDVVLGGTADDGQEDTSPNPDVTREIVARCARLEPSLARAEVVSVAVGLRPVRPTVRLEREDRPAGAVVHNYGHGGAGVTLSWGCAEAAARLLLGT